MNKDGMLFIGDYAVGSDAIYNISQSNRDRVLI